MVYIASVPDDAILAPDRLERTNRLPVAKKPRRPAD
jgi:hypothetical protein